MIKSTDLQEQHRELIMEQFDREVLESFRDMDRPSRPLKVSGVNTVYNFVEECHRFKTKKFELKGEDGFQESAETCRIISINARGNPVEPPPVEPNKHRNKTRGRRSAHH